MEQASSGRASRMNASESPLVPTGGRPLQADVSDQLRRCPLRATRVVREI